MKTVANLKLTLGFMIACSLFGSLVVLLMVTSARATTTQDYFWRKPLVGSIFLLICFGGSLVAVSPRNCSRAHETHMVETLTDSNAGTGSSVSSEGHHPNCGRFSAHTIAVKGKTYCAACTGLLIGGVAAMIVTALHFFFGLNSDPVSFPAIVVGQLGLGLGLIQSKFTGWIRSAANLLFVLGGSFMLVGTDQLACSVFIDGYVTGLVLLWILTRIMISQWDHHEICIGCGFSC